MSEHKHQVAFFRWFRMQYPDVIAYAIPNGGQRHPAVAKKLRDEGVLAGVPDVFIADGKPGLYIEMKNPDKGKLSKTQQEVIDKLIKVGYVVMVCFGWEEARSVVIDYFNQGIK